MFEKHWHKAMQMPFWDGTSSPKWKQLQCHVMNKRVNGLELSTRNIRSIIKYTFMSWAWGLWESMKQFTTQFEKTVIYHKGLALCEKLAQGVQVSSPRWETNGAVGSEHWLCSLSKGRGVGDGQGHSVSSPLFSGFKGLLLQPSPIYTPSLPIYNVVVLCRWSVNLG